MKILSVFNNHLLSESAKISKDSPRACDLWQSVCWQEPQPSPMSPTSWSCLWDITPSRSWPRWRSSCQKVTTASLPRSTQKKRQKSTRRQSTTSTSAKRWLRVSESLVTSIWVTFCCIARRRNTSPNQNLWRSSRDWHQGLHEPQLPPRPQH